MYFKVYGYVYIFSAFLAKDVFMFSSLHKVAILKVYGNTYIFFSAIVLKGDKFPNFLLLTWRTKSSLNGVFS